MTVRRASLRYPGHDHRRAGWYVLTINTHARQRLFGEIVDATMHPSPAGEDIVASCRRVGARFPGVVVETCVVVPDHLPIIVHLGTDPRIPATHAVPGIVGWRRNRLRTRDRYRVCEGTWPPCRGRLWQGSYHDRIIRNNREKACRISIEANPARWHDRHQPQG